MEMNVFFDINRPKRRKMQSYGREAVQQRMRLAMAFLNPLREVIAEGWSVQGKGNRSKAFGQALRALMQEALSGHYPDQYVLAERVLISSGMLPGVQVDRAVCEEQYLKIAYSGETTPLTSDSDEVVLVVYSPEAGVAGRNTEVFCRRDGQVRAKLPPQLRRQPFHAYLFVHDRRKRMFSKSIYAGYFAG